MYSSKLIKIKSNVLFRFIFILVSYEEYITYFLRYDGVNSLTGVTWLKS
jgi:hypothetical protein